MLLTWHSPIISCSIVLKGALLYHRDTKERKLLMFSQAKVKNYLVLHVLWEDKVLSYLNITRQNFPWQYKQRCCKWIELCGKYRTNYKTFLSPSNPYIYVHGMTENGIWKRTCLIHVHALLFQNNNCLGVFSDNPNNKFVQLLNITTCNLQLENPGSAKRHIFTTGSDPIEGFEHTRSFL